MRTLGVRLRRWNEEVQIFDCQFGQLLHLTMGFLSQITFPVTFPSLHL